MPLNLDISGFGTYEFRYLVCDLNGTLAYNGNINQNTTKLIEKIKPQLDIYLVSADTFGNGSQLAEELGIKFHRLGRILPQDQQKATFITKLGSEYCIAMGNGRNDHLMLESASLAIGIMGKEGIAPKTLLAADLVLKSPEDALNLLLHPTMLKASLRL